MREIEVEIQPLSETLDHYQKTFGHGPSIEAMKNESIVDLDRQAKAALVLKKPVKAWKDRPNERTGTIMDLLYGMEPEVKE